MDDAGGGISQNDIALALLTYLLPFTFGFIFYGRWFLNQYGWSSRLVHVRAVCV